MASELLSQTARQAKFKTRSANQRVSHSVPIDDQRLATIIVCMVANKGVTSEAMTTPITQGNAEAGLLQGNHSQQSKNIASAMLANQVIAEIRFSQIPQTQNFSLCRHNWQRPKIAAELAIGKYTGGGRIEKSGWVIHSKHKTVGHDPHPQFVLLQEKAQSQFGRTLELPLQLAYNPCFPLHQFGNES